MCDVVSHVQAYSYQIFFTSAFHARVSNYHTPSTKYHYHSPNQVTNSSQIPERSCIADPRAKLHCMRLRRNRWHVARGPASDQNCSAREHDCMSMRAGAAFGGLPGLASFSSDHCCCIYLSSLPRPIAASIRCGVSSDFWSSLSIGRVIRVTWGSSLAIGAAPIHRGRRPFNCNASQLSGSTSCRWTLKSH